MKHNNIYPTVRIISHTANPELAVATAAALCYSGSDIDGTLEHMTKEKQERLIGIVTRNGHGSVLEHASFTFGIEGVSRVLTHQLVRHRIASYSEKSQRYVKANELTYIIPESFKADKDLEQAYRDHMDSCHVLYSLSLKNGIPKEDARFVLPNATETKIFVTMNTRALLDFISKRTCSRAQWEIRTLANLMLIEVRKVAPTLFKLAGPPCITKGICPEGTMSCGQLLKLK